MIEWIDDPNTLGQFRSFPQWRFFWRCCASSEGGITETFSATIVQAETSLDNALTQKTTCPGGMEISLQRLTSNGWRVHKARRCLPPVARARFVVPGVPQFTGQPITQAPTWWPSGFSWPPAPPPGFTWPAGIDFPPLQGDPPPPAWPAGLPWPPPAPPGWPPNLWPIPAPPGWTVPQQPFPPPGLPNIPPLPPVPAGWPVHIPWPQPPTGWPSTADWPPKPPFWWNPDIEWPPTFQLPQQRPSWWLGSWPPTSSSIPGWPQNVPFPPVVSQIPPVSGPAQCNAGEIWDPLNQACQPALPNVPTTRCGPGQTRDQAGNCVTPGEVTLTPTAPKKKKANVPLILAGAGVLIGLARLAVTASR